MKKILLLLGTVLFLTTAAGRADSALSLNSDSTGGQLQTVQTSALPLSMTTDAR